MENSKTQSFVPLLVVLIPLGYLAFIYSDLPQTVPMHFDTNGEVDRWGSKAELVVMTLLMQVIAVGIFFLLRNLHKIDPKKSARLSIDAARKIALAIVIFIAALSLFILYATAHGTFQVGNFILPLLGLFLAYVGNSMYSIKQNYFLGLRTPWALEDEENWRKTHHLGSRLLFIAGISITVFGLFFHDKTASIILFAAVGVSTFVPFVYSYMLYRKQNKLN